MTTALLLSIASLTLTCGALVCYITVVIQMFMHEEKGVATASLVLFCCGIGILIAFVFGWIKAGEWENGLLMVAWTLCTLIGFGVRLTLYIAQHSM